jgi:hypothetical protein
MGFNSAFKGLIYKCLLKVFCPRRRPLTALDCTARKKFGIQRNKVPAQCNKLHNEELHKVLLCSNKEK